MSLRTLKIESPRMEGDDVSAWQRTLNDQLGRWGIPPQLKIDGDYGVATRALSSTVLHGLGIAQERMVHGITPELRIKVRKRKLTVVERARWAARIDWRRRLRKRLGGAQVSSPLVKIIGDSWGWHPGRHDGVDLICPPDAVIHSMTRGEVVRADAGGWWGLGAPSDPVLRAKGDGIIIVRCLEDAGPFRKGMNVCYGHAEHARVHAGQKVHAGQPIGRAGFANAWHIHLMINGNDDTRGVGDRDPRRFYNYARKHG